VTLTSLGQSPPLPIEEVALGSILLSFCVLLIGITERVIQCVQCVRYSPKPFIYRIFPPFNSHNLIIIVCIFSDEIIQAFRDEVLPQVHADH
jgi:hypothetical protein